VQESLRPLGIGIEGDGDDFVAVAPTWRPDLVREIDVVEEVARRVGFNQIRRTLPHTTGATIRGLSPRQRERRLLADVLVGAGASEAMTVPLIAAADLERFGLAVEGTVQATNALRAEEPYLRPAVLPGLVKAAAYNAGHGFTDLHLFELGHVFAAPPRKQLLPDERDHLAVVVTGTRGGGPVEPARPVDVYDVVDLLRAIAEALELADLQLVVDPAPGFDPVRSAAVTVDGTVIGHVGALAPGVPEAFGAPEPAVALEVDVDGLLGGTRRDRAFRTPSRYPVSRLDLAFVLAETVPAAAVQ
jgi:phenylalanyl-tRNA synthetase beta chain